MIFLEHFSSEDKQRQAQPGQPDQKPEEEAQSEGEETERMDEKAHWAHDDAAQPKNKAELYEMFKQEGPTAMICGFMEGPWLQNVVRVLVLIGQPLENSYYASISAAPADGWPSQLQFAAERTLGKYGDVVRDTLATLSSAKLHDALQLTKPTRMPQPEYMPDWATEEQQMLLTCSRFALTLAANLF